MKSAKILITAPLLIVTLMLARAEAGPTMAFGYLVNRSNDVNYEYLETIFPNSFASSIRNVFQVSVIKPNQIDKMLEKYGARLEKHYQPHELQELAGRLSADYFIFGSFIILPGDQIKISLNLYTSGTNRMFSFTNTGKMETEIFKLVDRITAIMIDFLGSDNYYMARLVPRGSRLGILTNLGESELNNLYCAFLKGGYQVASIQGNSLRNNLTPDMIENFKYVAGMENSFEIVSDPRAVAFLHGTWSSEPYTGEIAHIREAYRAYDREYLETRFRVLDRLARFHDIDKILIVGFNAGRTSAWVRCLDLQTRDLIWMQSNITGNITSICEKMMKRMSTDITQK